MNIVATGNEYPEPNPNQYVRISTLPAVESAPIASFIPSAIAPGPGAFDDDANRYTYIVQDQQSPVKQSKVLSSFQFFG